MSEQVDARFLEAVHSPRPVVGYTHSFYRYPARFSPEFVRAAIEAFTKPGDVVLDPFMGGGTTLVEARALGRRAIGTDINALAVFVARVKTTLLCEADLSRITNWASTLPARLSLRNPPQRDVKWFEDGYQKNASGRNTWHIRKTLELALAEVPKLTKARQRRFARCALLRTAQWALDCRTHIPTATEFRAEFFTNLADMICGARAFHRTVLQHEQALATACSLRVACLERSAVGLEADTCWAEWPRPTLILTSPPYPGVHVLYHRWQVQGRKETPAPFWIAESLDGNGASYYCFGDRKRAELVTYFEQAKQAFTSLAKVGTPQTLVVQMVAFGDPSWQLPKYLETMNAAGFVEVNPALPMSSPDGRMWRQVPNRKWYAMQRGTIPASKEVVLFHRLAR